VPRYGQDRSPRLLGGRARERCLRVRRATMRTRSRPAWPWPRQLRRRHRRAEHGHWRGPVGHTCAALRRVERRRRAEGAVNGQSKPRAHVPADGLDRIRTCLRNSDSGSKASSTQATTVHRPHV
jgi:hypothetical protein